MQSKAILALVVSMVFIGAYIWFRFQKLSYGLAAILALVHDVLITLGFVAISHWLFPSVRLPANRRFQDLVEHGRRFPNYHRVFFE